MLCVSLIFQHILILMKKMKPLKKQNKKQKKKIKKEQDESIINGENHNNTEIEEKPRSFEKAEDAAMVV